MEQKKQHKGVVARRCNFGIKRIDYRRTKCNDYWTSDIAKAYTFTERSAKEIAKRLNEQCRYGYYTYEALTW